MGGWISSVFCKNTKIETISDINGKFSIKVPDTAKTLEVLYIGYNTKEVAIEPRLTVYLEEIPETQSSSVNNFSQVEAVDLGLSVKWASCNVGARSPYASGSFFSWGETEEKTEYRETNSKTYNRAIGQIKGDNDVAHLKLGGNWRLPTLAEVIELVKKCKWTKETINEVTVMKAQGPNGNCIYFPYSGVIMDDHLDRYGIETMLWTSDPHPEDLMYGCALSIYKTKILGTSVLRYMGCQVRAVCE